MAKKNIKHHYFIILFFLIITTLSCNKEEKRKNSTQTKIETSGYLISGTIKNVSDSTFVYLYDINTVKDSTLILSEKFTFKGSVSEPTRRNIRLKNGRAVSFWIENQEIKIIAEKEKLQEASIIGGKTQKESLITKKSIDSIFKEITNVHKLLDSETIKKVTRDSLIKRQNDLFEEINKIKQQFIVDHPDSYVSVNSLYGYTSNWSKEKVKELYNPLTNKLKKSKYGQSIEHFLSLPKTPKIGEKYIDFELTDANNNPIKLSDVQGKYTLVEFWASWCYPCRKSNPELVKNYAKYKEKGFNIIGVSIDQRKKDWLKAIKDDELPWKQSIAPKGFKSDIALTYGISGIPENFIIDENGKIIAKTLRGDALENKLKELF